MKRFFFLIIMTVCAVGFSSCGKDEEETGDVDLKSYIVGSWHSYRMMAYGNGKNISVDVTKNNEYSAAYVEVNFSKDGMAFVSGWEVNSDGTSRWVTEKTGYAVEGNTVHLSDEYIGNDDNLAFKGSIGNLTRNNDGNEVISFIFEPTIMSLYVRFNTAINGMNIVGDLYLIK